MAAELAPAREGYSYPLRRRNDRRLPADWQGVVYLWDIDNTYLLTEWDSFRDLIRIRFEAAEDKRPVPGAVPLLGGLRRVAADGARPAFYFVSASPDTMRGVLEKRMLLDGVVHDGITFRDLTKLRYLRDIFGYKLAALLLYRLESPAAAEEVLFGDDREADPQVYTLYARICAGQVRGDELEAALEARGVRRSARRYIAALADELDPHDPVRWILIRRLRPGSPLPEGAPQDPRLVWLDDYAQGAALLRAAGLLGEDALREVVFSVREAGLGAVPLAALEPLRERLPAERIAAVQKELASLERQEL